MTEHVELKNLTLNFSSQHPAIKLILALLMSVIWSAYAFAGDNSQPITPKLENEIVKKLPPQLIYQGKPADPYCLEIFGSVTSFPRCEKEKIIRGELQYRDDGAIGYEYQKEDGKFGQNAFKGRSLLCRIFYRYLGMVEGRFPAILLEPSGKTGESSWSPSFGHVIIVKREGDELYTATNIDTHSGYACNGGLINVEVKNGKLISSQWLTAMGILDLAKDNPHQLEGAYDLEENDKTGCFAKAYYENGQLQNVVLEGLVNSEKDPSYLHPSKQACMDKIYEKYKEIGKTSLTVPQLKEFTHRFNNECVKSHKGI